MKDNIVGERIRARREAMKLNQTQLAEATGYADKTAISKIEKGVNDLTQSKIVIFAKALNTTPSYLMGWVDDPDMTKEDFRKQKLPDFVVQTKLREEELVAKAYVLAPQNVKDAIKTLLQIE